jgi:hypothetical protein
LIKTAVVLGLALTVAYFALPGAQAFILASAPILVALICPVAMIGMFFAMRGNKKDESAKPDESEAAGAVHREAGR